MPNMDTKKITENTAVSLSLVLLLIGSIIAGSIWVGKSIERDDNQDRQISELKAQIADFPTRNEFDSLKQSLEEIKNDVKKLLSK